MTAIPQHMQALASANAVRLKRHALKRDIAAGGTLAADVISAPPEYARTMTAFAVLSAQHRWGTSRSRKLLAVAQVREGKQLGDLTERQRRVLSDLLLWGTA